MENCAFCKIAAGDIPAQIIFQDENVVAFNDLNPQAPTHILVIPRKHVDHVDHAAKVDKALLGELLSACSVVASAAGITTTGYRVVTNIGADGGQSVGHLHFHVLGGRQLAWPPG